MTVALEKALSEIEEAKQDAAQSYAQLVIDLADDKEIDAAEMVEICGDAGRTVEDLRSAVNHLLHRRKLAEDLAGVPAATRQYHAKNAAVDALERERTAWLENWSRRIYLATQERTAALEEMTRRESAHDELVRSADQELHNRRERLISRQERLQSQLGEFNARIDRLSRAADAVIPELSETILKDTPYAPEQNMRLAKRSEHRQAVYLKKTATADRDRLKAMVKPLSDQLMSVAEELAEINRAMLTP